MRKTLLTMGLFFSQMALAAEFSCPSPKNITLLENLMISEQTGLSTVYKNPVDLRTLALADHSIELKSSNLTISGAKIPERETIEKLLQETDPVMSAQGGSFLRCDYVNESQNIYLQVFYNAKDYTCQHKGVAWPNAVTCELKEKKQAAIKRMFKRLL